MKIADRDAGITQQSTATGEGIAMGIRVEDMSHIMGVLTDLYKDKVAAVIREYATNAYDAHVAAGVTRPVEVTLPKAVGIDYSAFFTVRDYGAGLDRDDIAAVYSQYGRSTKRDSDDFVGALGLGCKAALTYCSLFTVESVKDAVKTVVEVGRAEGGGGVMKVVSQAATTDPNGTIVRVPVGRADLAAFVQKAGRFFRYWPEGSVLVDGKAPERFKALMVEDDLFVQERYGDNVGPKIVMGNVAYEAPQLQGVVPDGNLLAFVPIGAVNFPPSREGLADTAKTRTTIQSIKDRIGPALARRAQADIDAAPDAPSAMDAAIKWRTHLPRGFRPTYAYKGKIMPMDVNLIPAAYQARHISSVREVPEHLRNLTTGNSYGHNLSRAHDLDGLPMHAIPGSVWVLGYEPAKFTAPHKRKLQKLAQERSVEGITEYRLIRDGQIPADVLPFIHPERIWTWADVKAVKLPVNRTTVNGVSVRIPGSYNVWIDGDSKRGVPGAEFPASYPIFYSHGNIFERRGLALALKNVYDHYVLVCLPGNRIDKFKRDVPGALTGQDALTAACRRWVSTLTPAERTALLAWTAQDGANWKTPTHLEDTFDALRKIDPVKVTDEGLRSAAKACKLDTSALVKEADKYNRVSRARTELLGKWANPLSKYPLFSADLLASHPDDTYNYLNDAYARHSA